MIQLERQSLLAQTPASERLERVESACSAQGMTLGPVSDCDPEATLAQALLGRAGRRSPRYGELWERVLSLGAAFPGGRTLLTKGAPRAATGPDVTRTVLEARGKLGAIEQVTLRLRPSPRERGFFAARAPSLYYALDATRAVLHAGALASEVSVEGTPSAARLVLRFEGDAVLVAADLALCKRRLASFTALEPSETATLLTSESRTAEPEAGPPLLVEASWSSLREALDGAFSSLGSAFVGTARLRWLAHEGAGVELPWPRGVEPVAAPHALADDYLGRIAAALARRCS